MQGYLYLRGTAKCCISSILLIETAMDYASKYGIKHVIAFSRPAGFREYLRGKS